MNGGIEKKICEHVNSRFVLQELTENSCRFIKYKEFATEYYKDKKLVELTQQSYYAPDTYTMKVNKAPERVLDAVILVSRTSVNCYKVCYSNAQDVIFAVFSNQSDLITYLKAIQ